MSLNDENLIDNQVVKEQKRQDEQEQKQEEQEVSKQNLDEEIDGQNVENGKEPHISDSLTIIIKSITHRGTQTIIHCDPEVNRDGFIEIIRKTKV